MQLGTRDRRHSVLLAASLIVLAQAFTVLFNAAFAATQATKYGLSNVTLPPYTLVLGKQWEPSPENKTPVRGSSYEEEYSLKEQTIILLPSAALLDGVFDAPQTDLAKVAEFAHFAEQNFAKRGAEIKSRRRVTMDGLPAWHFVALSPRTAQQTHEVETHLMIAVDQCFVYHVMALYRKEHRAEAEKTLSTVFAGWKHTAQPSQVIASCKAN